MRRVVAGVLGVVFLGLACGGGERRCEALRSKGGLHLVYEVAGGDPAQVRDVLKRRLEAVDASCAEVRVEGAEVVVDLVGEIGADVPALLRSPGHLRIRPALPKARVAELSLPPRPAEGPEALRAWVATLSLPDGVDVRVEPERSGNPLDVHFLAADGGLTDPELADVRVQKDSFGPTVRVRLAEASARAFGDLTAAHVGETLVIELDGEVLLAAVVQEPLRGGEFSLTVGAATVDPEAWCERIATLLTAGAVAGRITLVSESTFGPSPR